MYSNRIDPSATVFSSDPPDSGSAETVSFALSATAAGDISRSPPAPDPRPPAPASPRLLRQPLIGHRRCPRQLRLHLHQPELLARRPRPAGATQPSSTGAPKLITVFAAARFTATAGCFGVRYNPAIRYAARYSRPGRRSSIATHRPDLRDRRPGLLDRPFAHALRPVRQVVGRHRHRAKPAAHTRKRNRLLADASRLDRTGRRTQPADRRLLLDLAPQRVRNAGPVLRPGAPYPGSTSKAPA